MAGKRDRGAFPGFNEARSEDRGIGPPIAARWSDSMSRFNEARSEDRGIGTSSARRPSTPSSFNEARSEDRGIALGHADPKRHRPDEASMRPGPKTGE